MDSEERQVIDYLKEYLQLPKTTCSIIYNISKFFKDNKRVEGIQLLENELIPKISKIKDLEKIEKIFDLLEGNLGLSKEDVHHYITRLFNQN